MAVATHDHTVAAELTGLGWELAQRFYDSFRKRAKVDYTPPWDALDAAYQESLAEAFEHMLSEDVIEVGPALVRR